MRPVLHFIDKAHKESCAAVKSQILLLKFVWYGGFYMFYQITHVVVFIIVAKIEKNENKSNSLHIL